MDVWEDEDIDWEGVVEEVEKDVNVVDVDEEEVDIPWDDVDEFVMDELLSVVCELVGLGGRDAVLQEESDQQVAAERRTSRLRRTMRRLRRTMRRWRRRRT